MMNLAMIGAEKMHGNCIAAAQLTMAFRSKKFVPLSVSLNLLWRTTIREYFRAARKVLKKKNVASRN